jgi:ribosomal protein S18 acetylase RimI-like enzyme
MTLDDITIRTTLLPGDLGSVVHLHGDLYAREYGYTIAFESYVARGLHEFWERYDATRDRVWVCEHGGRMIGFLLLMHRENNTAQLRYFLIRPEYRGIGLGKRLMDSFMEFFGECRYRSAYLWTTHEQVAAASLYRRYGFGLTEQKESTAFGKPLWEQRYDLAPPTLNGR